MDYSICIRTLGSAGEKYEKLIESIKRLSIKPKEVIIVIAKGYSLPKTDLENKRIVYSEKGMLLQRIIGYEEAKTEYVLLVDDDIEFESNLIEKLSKPILEKKSTITFPIYEELLFQSKFKALISACTLSSMPMKNDKNNFVKIMSSGGSKYNSNLENSNSYLYSESAPGMCVFSRKDTLINSNLREEMWIDSVGYPLREDAVLIYKSFLNNNKIIGIKGVKITHLDGGSSENNRNLKATYANSYNHILFWKRFIYERSSGLKKFKSILAIVYWATANIIFSTIKLFKSFDFEIYKISLKGIYDGFKFINKFS